MYFLSLKITNRDVYEKHGHFGIGEETLRMAAKHEGDYLALGDTLVPFPRVVSKFFHRRKAELDLRVQGQIAAVRNRGRSTPIRIHQDPKDYVTGTMIDTSGIRQGLVLRRLVTPTPRGVRV
jgi:hypothetical protein